MSAMSTVVVDVEGMTCQNCVRHVTEDVAQIPEVTGVEVDLRAGGTSAVTVTSQGAVEETALRAAVDKAGYTVTAVRPG